MNRIVGIIVRPAAEWDAVAREPASVMRLLARYIMPLSLIPSIAIVIGMTFFGAGWDPVHGYALPRERALAAGVANFAYAIATILLLALIFHWFARASNKPRRTYAEALQVAADETQVADPERRTVNRRKRKQQNAAQEIAVTTA